MHDLVGLLPAAGLGSRLAHIPTSKEIMPLGFHQIEHDGQTTWRALTPIEQHLRAFKDAGATRCVIVINPTKHDIMRYLGNGERFGLSLAYVVTPPANPRPLHGMPFSLNLARPWLDGATTLFAMPDTVITPQATLTRLHQAHTEHAADLTLGLFHTTTPSKFGMIALDNAGHPTHFVDKPTTTNLVWMWGIAAWSPRFATFLDAFLQDVERQPGTEVVLSDVFAAALAHLTVRAVAFNDARYHDIGTPADFQALTLELARQQNL
jgi:glucose-1-phosphate thymidylyltransferase